MQRTFSSVISSLVAYFSLNTVGLSVCSLHELSTSSACGYLVMDD